MHTTTDRTSSFVFNLAIRDASFPDSTELFTVAYSLHLPTTPSPTPLPILIFSHPFNNSREYWTPQVADPLLAPYPKVTLDAVGFAESSTHGRPWSFDAAAHSILVILDELVKEEVGLTAVVIGDSMGGGPTGLRVVLRDAERWKVEGSAEDKAGRGKVLGVVACGTCAEEESADFVDEYTASSHSFAASCRTSSPLAAISSLATAMASDGYTPSPSEPFSSARFSGASIIMNGLEKGLADEDGTLDPERAGATMVQNYRILDFRKSVLGELACRPSRLGERQVLVVHGTEDKAYPIDREYHTRTASAVGKDRAEVYVVEGGPHFVTVTHWEEVDRKIDSWIRTKLI